jgi:hypothetical protein
MEHITRVEIQTPEIFSKNLNQERIKIIGIKKSRRIASNTFSYLFENRETILNQINEMVFIENLHDEKEIQHVLKTYNDLIPKKDEFSVSMFIEISDEKKLLQEMPKLSGIENSVYITFGNQEIKAIPEEGRSTETLESTLQYLRFHFSPESIEEFAKAKNVYVTTRHRIYKESVEIPKDLLDQLKKEIA